MAMYQLCFMVLIALLALAAIILMVLNGGLTTSSPCLRANLSETDGGDDFDWNDVTRKDSALKELQVRLDECTQAVTSLGAQCTAATASAATAELAQRQIDELTVNKTKLQTNLQKCDSELIVASTNLEEMKNDLEECSNKSSSLQSENSELKTRLQELENSHALCKSASILLQNKISSLQSEIDDQRLQLEMHSSKSAELQLEISEYRMSVAQLTEQLAACSNSSVVTRSELNETRAANLKLKAQNINCTAASIPNTTRVLNRTLTMAFIKFITRCQEKVRGSPLVRLETGQYLFSTYDLNWYDAAKKCNSLGLELASVESARENEALVSEARRLTGNEVNRRFWLSGTDLGREGTFSWLSTGRDLRPFTAWHPSEPNNAGGGEHCLQLWNRRGVFGWCDFSCSVPARFVCELPAVCKTNS